MTATKTKHPQDLARRLAEAEATIEALLAGQIDAVVDPKSKTPVLLAKAQDALRDSEARKAAVLNSVLDCIVTMGADGLVSEFNAAAERTFGYTTTQAVGRRLADLIIPARFREAHAAGLARILATGEGPLIGRLIEVTAMRSDGSEIPVELAITAIRSDKATIFTGVLRDITARKQADETEAELKRLNDEIQLQRLQVFQVAQKRSEELEHEIGERNRAAEALRIAEERMRFALEAAGVGIWDMDYTTGVHRWSEILEAQYGLQPGTFGGTFEAFVERIHPDDRESVIQTVARAAKSGGDFSIQNRSIWPDGTVRWLSGSGRVHLGEHGEPVRALGITLDVTERQRLETQYQQAQKMEAVGRLAGGVAHDFNNLLMVITGYSDLLLQGLMTGDSRRQDLEQIRKAADAAASLTRQLLAFSRQQVIEPTMVVLEDVVSAATKMLTRLIGEDVDLVTRLNETTATIRIDPGQLEQVIMNLAVNARDAMPTGGKLTIETSIVELTEEDANVHWPATPGRFAMLAVSDTGVGMDEHTRAQIFEPFFTTKDPGKGTGLGLATVYGIVKQNDGFVWVYSEPGQGATFKIYLPLFGDAPAAAGQDSTDEITPRGRETILLVEDSDGVRDIARRVLERQGYNVIEAPNATAALDMASSFTGAIGLLLTDIVMPEMSGRVLAERFAQHHPQAKLLFMSGYTDDAVVRHGVLHAETPYLQKPFSPHALATRVREVLDAA